MGCSQSASVASAHPASASAKLGGQGPRGAFDMKPCAAGAQVQGLKKAAAWRRLSCHNSGEAIKVYEGPLYEVRTTFNRDGQQVAEFMSRVDLNCQRVVAKEAWSRAPELASRDLEEMLVDDHLDVLTDAGLLDNDRDTDAFYFSQGTVAWRRGCNVSSETCASDASTVDSSGRL